jgi:hypothetical protein
MTTQSQLPLKWYVPFASGAAPGQVQELPVTSADPTRASQTLGFPPLTMQPPESGGVPPQGPDVNGGMNQIARVCWWMLNGGGFPYDATFATNANILGYPNGAVLQRADFAGEWLNLVDSNQVNPDTATGAVASNNWAPLFVPYGRLNLTSITGGTLTLTYAQAAFDRILVSGTLTSNETIVVPNWVKRWILVNNTTGGFTLTIQPVGGTGVLIPQNATEVPIVCDGTNMSLPAYGGALTPPPAVSSGQAVTFGQVSGLVGQVRNLRAWQSTAAGTLAFTADEIIVETALGGLRYCLPSFNQTVSTSNTNLIGGVVGAALTTGFAGIYAAYNPTTGAQGIFAVNANALVPNVAVSPPTGWVATGLISVWPCTATNFGVAYQSDRNVSTLANSFPVSAAASLTSISIASAVPVNAKACNGYLILGSTAATSATFYLASSAGGIGQIEPIAFSSAGATSNSSAYSGLQIIATQTIFYTATNATGTPTFSIQVCGYTF